MKERLEARGMRQKQNIELRKTIHESLTTKYDIRHSKSESKPKIRNLK